MSVLGSAPKVPEFVNAWHGQLTRAVESAAGKDGRISLSEAKRLAARTDAMGLFGDNVVNYLEAVEQKSVSVAKFLGTAEKYAYAVAGKAAGSNGRLSLLEARTMSKDLVDDFMYLRGKLDRAAAGPSFADLSTAFDTIMKAADDEFDGISDGAYFELQRFAGAKSIEDVAKVLAEPYSDSEILDWQKVYDVRGPDAFARFESQANDLRGAVWDEHLEHWDALTALAGSTLGELSDVQLVQTELYGSQYGRSRNSLVGRDADGTFVAFTAAYVG